MNEISTDLREANILIVDDETVNLRFIEKILEMYGFTNVTCTQDPTQAATLYQEKNSDLVLLDLNMPKLDGYGVLGQLNTLTQGKLPPVLVLTAQHQQKYRQRALDMGALDYVTKPFDVDELISRVRNLLEVQMAKKYMENQNGILEQKVRERTQEINDTRLQVVRHLGRAAEYRDNETGFHIIRMSKVAALIAKEIGMPDNYCYLLLNASPMHDIGKIGIPDYILLKPGKLNAQEWEEMKKHAQIGADILADDDSDLMVMAHDIALSHHEKYNGTGYPNGLNADEIPLAGRITALADVFDALISVRPYKEAWTVEAALNLIKNESGQHFDPMLVDVFIKNISKIIAINEHYAEPLTDDVQRQNES